MTLGLFDSLAQQQRWRRSGLSGHHPPALCRNTLRRGAASTHGRGPVAGTQTHMERRGGRAKPACGAGNRGHLCAGMAQNRHPARIEAEMAARSLLIASGQCAEGASRTGRASGCRDTDIACRGHDTSVRPRGLSFQGWAAAQVVVIDCRTHMLGRLASVVAKQLLLGQHVVRFPLLRFIKRHLGRSSVCGVGSFRADRVQYPGCVGGAWRSLQDPAARPSTVGNKRLRGGRLARASERTRSTRGPVSPWHGRS